MAEKKLGDLVERLEAVNASLEKRETVPLRQEQNELMRDIQQHRQAEREGRVNAGDNPSPTTVSSDLNVNGD